MAACIAAVQTLCPELEAYVAKGIGSTGSG
jgi:hypothetical protein